MPCPTLCNPMDGSTPGFPIFHCLPEFAHVHWVSDGIQPHNSNNIFILYIYIYVFLSPIILPCVKKGEGYTSWVCHIAKYTPSCHNFQNDTSKTQIIFCYPTQTHTHTHAHTPSTLIPAVFTFCPVLLLTQESISTLISQHTHSHPTLQPPHLPQINRVSSRPPHLGDHTLFLLSGTFFHPLSQTPPTQFLISLHSFNLLLINPTERSFLTPNQVRTLAYGFTQYPRYLQSSYQNCHFYHTKSSLTFVFATGL